MESMGKGMGMGLDQVTNNFILKPQYKEHDQSMPQHQQVLVFFHTQIGFEYYHWQDIQSFGWLL